MRTIPGPLAAHLAGGATTLAHCWRLTRCDGVVLGFTDHDESLTFDGTGFEATSGLTGSEVEEALGLGAQTREVAGALSSSTLTAEDIAAGRYDGARVETFVVNWQKPADHVLMDVCDIGEVKHGETGFSTELRSIADRLDRVRGRLYRRRCDAVFGDRRCRADATAPPYRYEGSVLSVDGRHLRLEGEFAAAEKFIDGRIQLVSDGEDGAGIDIAAATRTDEGLDLTLSDAPPSDGTGAIKPGDRIAVTVGCDKLFATCRDRFANAANFRGFPHIPGGDAALAVAKRDGVHDGSPVVP